MGLLFTKQSLATSVDLGGTRRGGPIGLWFGEAHQPVPTIVQLNAIAQHGPKMCILSLEKVPYILYNRGLGPSKK